MTSICRLGQENRFWTPTAIILALKKICTYLAESNLTWFSGAIVFMLDFRLDFVGRNFVCVTKIALEGKKKVRAGLVATRCEIIKWGSLLFVPPL